MRLRDYTGGKIAQNAKLGAAVLMFFALASSAMAQSQESLRDLIPQIEDAELTEKLKDAYLYTENEIPRAYQHDGGVHSVWYNISADNSEPFGNANREFPWGMPAGTQNVQNLYKFTFVVLPRDSNGRKWPIVYFGRPPANGVTENVHFTTAPRYAWTYPDGAIVGEVLCLYSPQGTVMPFEVRTRTRTLESWEVNVYRPFPTAKDLLAAVEGVAGCEELVESLYRPATVVSPIAETNQVTNDPFRIRSTQPNAISFDSVARMDQLPPIKEDLVTWLLYHPFKSAEGAEWKEGCAAPTTKEAYHIVPAMYRASHVPVDGQTCMQCHKETNQTVSKFDIDRDWYGFVRGSDGIFSLHPFDRSCISTNGFTGGIVINRQLVKEGIFAAHDPRIHPSSVYKQIKGIR